MLDFVIGSDGLIWVLLDEKWDEAATAAKMVRTVKWDSVAEEVSVCTHLSQYVSHAFL